MASQHGMPSEIARKPGLVAASASHLQRRRTFLTMQQPEKNSQGNLRFGHTWQKGCCGGNGGTSRTL
jgi:hypothetical protein